MKSPPLQFEKTTVYIPQFKKRFAFGVIFLDLFLVHNFLLHFVLGIAFNPIHFFIIIGAYLTFFLGIATIITLFWTTNKPSIKQLLPIGCLLAPLFIQKFSEPSFPQLLITQGGMLYDMSYEFYGNGTFKYQSLNVFFIQVNYGSYTQKGNTLSLEPWPTYFHSEIISFKQTGNRGYEGYTNDSLVQPQHYTKFLLED